MTEAPELSLDELRSELALVHRTKHRALHTLLCAKGPDNVSVPISLFDGEVMFLTRSVTCELDIRRALSNAKAGENLALLIDHELGQLPADLVGRLAKGKIVPVDARRRLLRLFGALSLSAELASHPALTKALLARPLSGGGGRPELLALDLTTAVRALLLRDAGIPMDGELQEERLLLLLATMPVPQAAIALLGPGTELGGEVETFFRQHLGPVAPILWRGWLRGLGPYAAALTFVIHAIRGKLTTQQGLRIALSMVLARLDGALAQAPTNDHALLARWGDLAPGLRRRLGPQAAPILAQADALLTSPDVRQELYESPYLPSAFEVTSDRLAAALDAALAGGSSCIDTVRTELERLAAHDLGKGEKGETVQRTRMAARLVAYLGSRPNISERARTFGSNGEVIALAQHYLSDGAYVDLARDRARGVDDTALEAAITRVLAVADKSRDADDECFAGAYAGWLSSGSPSNDHIVPIHEGIESYAERFLKDAAHRKLLVLLLDGMSWANAVELLQSCEEAGYAPLRRGSAEFRPMLAAMPSITGVSRSAFFGGKSIKSGQMLATGKDPERFAGHATWRRLRIEVEPELLLKDRLETPSGDVRPEALELVRSAARVVGVVVNALDDQLKGPRQMRVPADLDHIRPLRRLLEAALDGGRAVLLVADHGHVRTSRMAATGRSGDGKRYRFLGSNDALVEGEVAVSREHAWTPAGKTHAAMLVRETDAFGAVTSSGEHGGASLSEVVTPALLIGHDALRERRRLETGIDDHELEPSPLLRPRFWDLDVPKAATRPAVVEKIPAKPKKDPRGQLALPEPALRVSPPAPMPTPAAPESLWLLRLRRLEWPNRDARRFREEFAARVALIADRGGTMPAEAFARELSIAPRNVAGAVTELQEWVNFDAYPVLQHEAATKRVTLDLDLLTSFLKENDAWI